MQVKKKRQKKPPEPYWQLLVETYYRFCRMYFGVDPSFDSSAPRDLRTIVEQLRTRCEKSNKIWDEESSVARLWLFLRCAYEDPWLSKNFLLSNINRQKDKIFFNAAQNVAAQNH